VARSGLGPEYKKLWTASAISNLGDGVVFAAAPLLAASLTRDPVLVAGVLFAQLLPWPLFSLHAGAIIDRLDRRMIMGSVDAFRATVVGFLGIAVFLDFANIPLLYVVFFLLGTAETFFDNAATAILPSVVPRERLEGANGGLETVRLIANELTGPPLGGFLFAAAASVPFLLDAGTFAAACALVLAMKGSFRTERPEGAPPTTLLQEIGEGLRWLLGHRLLLTLAFMLGSGGLALFGAWGILVLYAQEVLGLGSFGYGVLLGASAVGGLAAGLLTERIVESIGTGRTTFCVIVLGVISFVGLALTSEPVIAGFMLALLAFQGISWNVATISLRQRLIPDRLLGRVGSAFRMIGLGGMALGTLLGGFLARSFGLTAPFWFAAAVMAVLSGVALVAVNNRAVKEAMEEAQP
jgi:MFS family permease